ncbi:MAG: precorrin-6A reductase [Bacillota bacterium]|nr:precorrin-6A reductase [Bacillota bacterium]
MKIVIFGGTTEGRELSSLLASAGADVTVSVVSGYGAEEQNASGNSGSLKIEEGPRDENGMRLLLADADICVDATHPYAVEASANIRSAAEAENVEVLRLKRASVSLDEIKGSGVEDLYIAEDPAEAARIAAGIGGRILLTTGSKDLHLYGELLDSELLFPRVLPLSQSIDACEKAGIPHRNIIAVQGPFSEAFNRAVIDEYQINVLITKESGRAGGFMEKINACKSCGIPAVVISRPADEGLSFDEVRALCMEKLK